MLAIELLLLTGNYVATAYNDRTACEWPPHPARLFSALVATHHMDAAPSDTERQALLWLEQQPAPHLTASDVHERATCGRDVHQHFVPVNDISVLGKMAEPSAKVLQLEVEREQAEQALADARNAGDAKDITRLEKAVMAAEKKLAKKRADHEALVQKAVRPQAKETAAALKASVLLLPEHRLRQARTFPSIAPESNTVVFAWPDARPTTEIRAALEQLLLRVTRVGHSSSLVRLRLLQNNEVPQPSFVPRNDGTTYLRTTATGQLQRLEAAFALHQESRPRVMPATFQTYGPAGPRLELPSPRMSNFGHQPWLVLEVADGRGAVLGTQVAAVSRAVRSALMAMHGERSEFLSGHSADGKRTPFPHLAVVPLPFVGSRRADGHVLGVAMIFPRECSEANRALVYDALSKWGERHSGSAANPRKPMRAPMLSLHLPGGSEYHLRLVTERPRLQGLMNMSWIAPRTRWVTATPIALDHNPGDLYCRNPAKAARAYDKAGESIAQSCAWLGLPAPSLVLPMLNAPLSGGTDARRFPAFPQARQADSARQKYQRVLVHAQIEFPEPVMGPLLIGAGRYHGLGLLRPVDERPAAPRKQEAAE